MQQIDFTQALETAIPILLKALKWQGSRATIFASRPHASAIDSVEKFCAVFENLGFTQTKFIISEAELDEQTLPCLCVQNNKVFVLQEKLGGIIKAFDCNNKTEAHLQISRLKTAYFFSFTQNDEAPKNDFWATKLFSFFEPIYWQIWLLSFIQSLFGLGVPLFIMSVYNQVIGTYSLKLLWQYTIGIGLVLFAVVITFWLRSKIAIWLGQTLNQKVSRAVIHQILNLSPIYTDSTPVSSQVARIKEFEQVRDFISNPATVILFELPFTILFLIAIGLIAKSLVLIPIVITLIFCFLCILTWFSKPNKQAENMEHYQTKNELLVQALYKLKQIKNDHLSVYFGEHFKQASATTSIDGFKSGLRNTIASTLSDMLVLFSGLLTITIGALAVMTGNLSAGGLIAIMIMNWRTIGPFKVVYTMLPTIKQIINTVKQIERLMQIPAEKHPHPNTNLGQFTGNIKFNALSFRYPNAKAPALNNFSCRINPGEIVALVGPTSSGKSTLLKLLLGLYAPQFGSIEFGDTNIEQINPTLLRTKLAYAAQTASFFYGTIKQNIQLASPLICDAEIKNVCRLAGIDHIIEQLPEKYETRIKDQQIAIYGDAFKQGLNLARAYARHAKIILLDEPLAQLDERQTQRLAQYLTMMRGRATIIFSTHRPSFARMADKLIVLNKGQVVAAGNPKKILEKLPRSLI